MPRRLKPRSLSDMDAGHVLTRRPSASPLDAISLIEDVRELIVRERPTFHVFKVRQELLLYDLCSGSLVALNPATYALLRSLEAGLSADEVLGATLDAGATDLREYIAEIRELHSLGLFRLEPLETREQRTQTLAKLQEHRQRNLMLMVQTSCNLACDYCYEVLSGFHHTGGKMSFEVAKATIDDYLRRSGARKDITVTFFGGEPLLNFPVIRQCVNYCLERAEELGKKIRFSMTTNGTLLSDSIIGFLIEHKFVVMLSMDGDPQKADVRRHDPGGEGATAQALERGLALLDAQRVADLPELSVRATLTKENGSRQEVYDFFYGAGFRRIMIAAAGSRKGEDEPWLLGSEDQAANVAHHERLLEAYVAWSRGGRDFPERRQIAQGLKTIKQGLDDPRIQANLSCGVGNNMLAVTEDGKMYPCHRYAGEERHALGDIGDGGLDRERLNRFYEGVLDVQDGVCSGCWARFTCTRPCPWTLSNPDGTIRALTDEGCNRIRADIERSLWACAMTAESKQGTNSETTSDLEEGC